MICPTKQHKAINEKFKDLIEWTFQWEGSALLAYNKIKNLSLLLHTNTDINVGHVKLCLKPDYIQTIF